MPPSVGRRQAALNCYSFSLVTSQTSGLRYGVQGALLRFLKTKTNNKESRSKSQSTEQSTSAARKRQSPDPKPVVVILNWYTDVLIMSHNDITGSLREGGSSGEGPRDP